MHESVLRYSSHSNCPAYLHADSSRKFCSGFAGVPELLQLGLRTLAVCTSAAEWILPACGNNYQVPISNPNINSKSRIGTKRSGLEFYVTIGHQNAYSIRLILMRVHIANKKGKRA